jgi:hypothetical protein
MWTRTALLALTFAWVPPGCKTPLPASLAPDLQAEGECVVAELLSGVTSVSAVAGKCTGGEEKLAIDLIDWAISSVTTASKIAPTTVATMRAEVERRRALPAH